MINHIPQWEPDGESIPARVGKASYKLNSGKAIDIAILLGNVVPVQ